MRDVQNETEQRTQVALLKKSHKKRQKALKPLVQTLTVKEQGKRSRFKQKKVKKNAYKAF